MKSLSEITKNLKTILGKPFTEHRWVSSNTYPFIKMSFFPDTAEDSEHYEITFDEENNLFYVSLHYENKRGQKYFEKFIDQNIDNEFLKKEQEWQKTEYEGEDLTFYMLEGQEKIKNDDNVIENLSNLIRKTYEKFNPELEKFYLDKENYIRTNTIASSDKYQQIIDTYIDFCINKKDDWHEDHKWETIKFFQKKWQPNIDNQELKSILDEILEIQTNLMSWQKKDNFKKIPTDYFEQLKQILNYIFDENIDIQERYKYFQTQIDDISTQLNKELKLNEDIFAFFLTCRYPEKYYFYRFEYYKNFCNFIGEKSVSKKDTSGEKYFHYLKIVQHLNDKYVKTNQKIQNITNEFLLKKRLKIFDSKNILTQSIIWIAFGYDGGQIIKNNDDMKKNKSKRMHLNQILFGPPGTGKTYNTIDKSIQIIDNDFYEKNKLNRNELKKRFKQLKEDSQIVFTTFHQSMSYEEFVEGLKPDEKGGEIFYEVKKGIFRQICEVAEKNHTENYVLIIDEINRGNIASIFGELITLIEPDKRKDAEEELFVKLPYSKTEFTVPKNLYIIGTMNTADRSVEALDSALRRRFVFEEMPPDETLLDENFEDINLQKLLEKINIRIEKLIDKDHKIGHSYFMNLSNIENLRIAFKTKLIPLLEEYFYGDFAKIGLILGKYFIKKDNAEENIFKNIDSDEDYSDFESRTVYKIIVPNQEEKFVDAVKNIYL